MINNHYYTLIASLPALPRFDKAERLPISHERIDRRLRMLEEGDAAKLDQVIKFLLWQKQPVVETNEILAKGYRDLMEMDLSPDIKNYIELRMALRTIVAALRRKYRELPPPQAGEVWGVGRWVKHIENHWEDGDFKLGSIFPWIAEARGYLVEDKTVALEKLLMNTTWNWLDRLAMGKEFEFETVVAYFFKWELVNRWLTYNRKVANERFKELVSEVYSEQEEIFR